MSHAHVVRSHARPVPPRTLYHLHVPKCAGTSLAQLLPRHIAPLMRCDAFAEKLYKKPLRFADAARALRAGEIDCNFVSVEGDFEAAALLPNDTVIFTMLREPLSLLISQWRHDMAKGKFESIDAKYALVESGQVQVAADRQPMIGFGANSMTLRIGSGLLKRAKERLHGIEFGVVEHFHASVCLLLFVINRRLFDTACVECDKSPLSEQVAANAAAQRADGSDAAVVPLHRLQQAMRANLADQRLYTYAYELFWARIRHVQRETGRQLICDDPADDQQRWFRGPSF